MFKFRIIQFDFVSFVEFLLTSNDRLFILPLNETTQKLFKLDVLSFLNLKPKIKIWELNQRNDPQWSAVLSQLRAFNSQVGSALKSLILFVSPKWSAGFSETRTEKIWIETLCLCLFLAKN